MAFSSAGRPVAIFGQPERNAYHSSSRTHSTSKSVLHGPDGQPPKPPRRALPKAGQRAMLFDQQRQGLIPPARAIAVRIWKVHMSITICKPRSLLARTMCSAPVRRLDVGRGVFTCIEVTSITDGHWRLHMPFSTMAFCVSGSQRTPIASLQIGRAHV